MRKAILFLPVVAFAFVSCTGEAPPGAPAGGFLSAGSDVAAFNVKAITGPHKGAELCYV